MLFFLLKKYFPTYHARRIGVKFGNGCRFLNVDFGSEPYLISIGNHVSATSVKFITHDGGVWVFRNDSAEIDVVKPIVVGNNVFLGLGVIVLPGVVIGDNVVIGAGAIVSKNIPSNSIAVGTPARVISTLESYKQKVFIEGYLTKRMPNSMKKAFYLSKFSNLK